MPVRSLLFLLRPISATFVASFSHQVVVGNPKRLLDCENFDCADDVTSLPVCGTDGNTYASQCVMDMENKKRVCWMGHFNMIEKVHDGPCNPTTTSTVSAVQ